MLEMEWWILLEILAAAMTRLYGCCICVIKAYQLNMGEHLCNDTKDVGSTPTQAV